MVGFLIKRPIAVSMTFIAILVLGVFAMKYIPVSLMPDIDIPEVTVQVSLPNTPARELENTVVKPIRRQLVQVAHLADITSETRNENSIIHLEFEYGTDIDFAFIEVNEKIDRAMNYLPKTVRRPRVIKASATDIPVFYLNLTTKGQKSKFQNPNPKTQEANNGQQPQKLGNNELYPVSQKFVELGRFASNVIRKRIEQLPEVAMVDMSGLTSSELLILPDYRKMETLGITPGSLKDLIEGSNIKLGNLLIRDGQYQYNIRFSSTLRDKTDIENIYFKIDERLVQLKEIAEVVEHPQKQAGKVTFNGKDAVTFAVIKQSDAQMSGLKDKLNSLISHFEKDYPNIDFHVTRDQTKLLDYSIDNLGQSLVLGASLAFLIMFLFLKDFKAPLLIGITIPSSLIISMLFFYVIGISINIISLSGIILGVGMMIDNSIIVIDNITQHRERGGKGPLNPALLIKSCVNGTNEVFRPMLSSVLTTCSVFIPLIFISGISGALFYDQAMAVTIGLLVSLLVSITLLPVYYKLFYGKSKRIEGDRFLRKVNPVDYARLYEKGFRFVMKKQAIAWMLSGLFLGGAWYLYTDLEKSKLPPISKDETLLIVDWNERIHIDENARRANGLLTSLDKLLFENTCLVGKQQFIMDKASTTGSSEVVIYMKAKSPEGLAKLTGQAGLFLDQNYPSCRFHFEGAGNIFNMVFPENEAPLVSRLRAVNDNGPAQISFLQKQLNRIRSAFTGVTIPDLALYEYSILNTDQAKLLLYEVDFNTIYTKLKSAFNENRLLLIADNQDFVPVVLGDRPASVRETINKLSVRNKQNELVPLRNLVSESRGQDLKTIVAGKEGEYYPVPFDVEGPQAERVMQKIQKLVGNDRQYEVNFSGGVLDNQSLMKELMLILLVSLALLYFILASQFESLSLPLIVLIEVPIDVFGAFLALKLGGAGINLMSLIGIIVMSGIIINDSILKIDTINQLQRKGYSLMYALVKAGHRRLKPILMTSLTTILALVPFLFTTGLGSDLQRPLALAVIGGMALGTIVSLYLVPLMYYYLKRRV